MLFDGEKIKKMIDDSSSESQKEKPETSSDLSREAVTIIKTIEGYRKELKEYKQESDKQINEQEERIKQIRKGFNTEFNEQKKEVKNMKIDFIAVIGIFVSIFTFISIEIQILRYICDFWRIAGFSLIIFGSLSGFVILIHSIFSQKIENKSFIFCVIVFLLGIAIGSVPDIFNINNACVVNITDNINAENTLEIKINDEFKNSEVQNKIENQNNNSVIPNTK